MRTRFVPALSLAVLAALAACRDKVVTAPVVTPLTASQPAQKYLEKSETFQVPLVTNAPANNPVTWTSSSDTVARVSATGVVTANTPGSANICSKVTGYGQTQTTCTHIDVVSTLSIAVAPPTISLVAGDSSQAAFVIAGGLPSASHAVTWTTRNAAIATVSSTGYIRGISAGTTTIVVTSVFDITKFAQVAVTVTAKPVTPPPPAGPITITLNPTTATLVVGDSITPIVTRANIPAAMDTTLTWSSSSATATVTNTGKIKGVSPGTATITVRLAADTSKKATIALTINAKPVTPPVTPVVTGIAVVPAVTSVTVTFAKDTSLTVAVSVAATGGNTAYTCFSSNLSFLQATIDNAGVCKFKIIVGYPNSPLFVPPQIIYETLGVGSDGLKKRVAVTVIEKK